MKGVWRLALAVWTAYCFIEREPPAVRMILENKTEAVVYQSRPFEEPLIHNVESNNSA